MNLNNKHLRARWASIPGVSYPTGATPPPPPLTSTAASVTTAEARHILGTHSNTYTNILLYKHNIPSACGPDGIKRWDSRAVKKLAAARRHPSVEWISKKDAIANYRGANPTSLWNAARLGHIRTRKVNGRIYYHRADLALRYPQKTPHTAPQPTPDWTDTAAAMAALGCARSTLYRLHLRGKLRRVSIFNKNNRKTYLYHPGDIAKLINS